ncbi:hypothetical protein NE236_30905 [Actinoallomurus purpureus]|uniref:hypothetical protein n=1 Tax=Actinoallomurus purpureus TaxID=478114 RepID=UPI00209362BC|nr:hypothetical protein [Actinoallomurus purpureus]MCO6009390.1 hypothetical protein [Actinoallomurus purpureus]
MKLALRILAAGSLAAALVGTMNGAADASTSDSTVTATATRAAGPGQPPVAITCKITTHLPSYAYAAGRRVVKVTADIECNKSVKGLTLRVSLYKNNVLYKRRSSRQNAGESSISQSAARRCIKNRHYFGRATGTITFPPHYNPQKRTITSKSGDASIAACKKK